MKKTAAFLLVLLVLSATHNSYATVGYLLPGAGPVSTALGGTGASYNIGSDAMIYNPATLMLLPVGGTFQEGLDVLITRIDFKDLPGHLIAAQRNRGNNNDPFFLPAISYVLRKDRFAIGMGVFPGGGLGVQYGSSSWLSDAGNAGTHLDVADRFIGIRAPLAFAYQMTNRLAVGGAIDAVYEDLNLRSFVPGSELQSLAAAGLATGSLVASLGQVPGLVGGYVNFYKNSPIGGALYGWGVGGRLGLTYRFDARTRVGMVYNFQTDVANLTGGGQLSAVTINGALPLYGRYTVYNFQLPASFIVGISRKVADTGLVTFDFKRILFAAVNRFLSFGFSQDAGGSLNVNIPTYGPNVDVFALGGAYRVGQNTILRGGVQYAQEPENPKFLSALLPGIPTVQFTAGIGYRIGKRNSVDLALEYANKTETGYPFQTTHIQYQVSLGYAHHF